MAFAVALATGCVGEPVRIDLLPATSTGRIEAVVQVPRSASLHLELAEAPRRAGGGDAPVPALEVWTHRADSAGALLAAREIGSGEDAPPSLDVDLGAFAGERVLLAATVRGAAGGVDWAAAEVTGRGGARALDESGAPRPDVVLYLIDALRADALGVYGRDDTPTPRLDRLAREGVRFASAWTPATWTRPATASLFTGLYPTAHGAVDRPDALPETALTLAERMRFLGYRTVGVVANGNVDPLWGFDQGFDTYLRPRVPDRDRQDRPRRHLRAGEVHAAALDEVRRLDGDRPLFLYVHTVDPHGPYDPPVWLLDRPRPTLEANSEQLARELNTRRREAEPDLLEALRAVYQGEVAYADRALGELLDGLAELRDPEGSVVAVTADHGEAFQEHGFSSHGMSLFEEELRVPLIFRGPGRVPAGEVVEAPVSLVDVAPTLVALAGAGSETTHGIDLSRLWSAGAEPLRRPVFAEIDYDGRTWRAARLGSRKLLVHRDRSLVRLFDLASDPRERRDLSRRRSAEARELRRELREWEEGMERARLPGAGIEAGEPDDELVENLRALGYVE